MSRKLAFWIVALLALVTLIFANKQPTPGTNWTELVKTRRKNAYARDLVAFGQFLSGQMNGMSECSYGFLYDGFRDNTSFLEGTLLQDWKVAGHFQIRFYYDGTNPDPSSREVHLALKPELIEKAHSAEWKSLLKRTQKEGEVRTTFGDIQWFSTANKQGDIDLTLRIPSPTRWYPNVPDYDRGYTDEMYFGVTRRALAYLYKEAFLDPYTKVEFRAPSFNPPNNVSHLPIGNNFGFIYPKDGPPLSLEIEEWLSGKESTLHIQIKPLPHGSWSQEQAKKVFKPEFLASLNKNPDAKIVLQGDTMEASYFVAIQGPIDAFPEPKPR